MLLWVFFFINIFVFNSLIKQKKKLFYWWSFLPTYFRHDAQQFYYYATINLSSITTYLLLAQDPVLLRLRLLDLCLVDKLSAFSCCCCCRKSLALFFGKGQSAVDDGPGCDLPLASFLSPSIAFLVLCFLLFDFLLSFLAVFDVDWSAQARECCSG